MLKFLFALALLALSCVAQAQATAPDPALERHVMAISQELRCLVCQNQTIADSHADLAVDLRNQVREKLQQGMADKDIYDYMVQRYGDFVLYRPPVNNSTWLLWFGPFLLMLGGLVLLGFKLARGRPQAAPLPPAEMQRAANLLAATTDLKEEK